MTPHEKLVTAIAACVVVAAVIGYLFHWYVLDVREWLPRLRGLLAWLRPLPDLRRALVFDDDWQREPVTDQDADLLIAEWRDDSPGRDWDSSRTPAPAAGGHQRESAGPGTRPLRVAGSSGWRGRFDSDSPQTHLEQWHERMWWDDPDLTVWDARQAALRCWEILHIEFPRLRAELGIPA